MPQIVFTPAALRDLDRLQAFLAPKSQSAAQRAAGEIITLIRQLSTHPQIGRPADRMEPAFRELLVNFASSGYVVLYRYDHDVLILAIRHQREAGYILVEGS